MRALLVPLLALSLAACLGSSPDDGAVRFIHAAPALDTLDVLIDGRVVFASRLLGDTTGYRIVEADEQDVLVRSSTDRSLEAMRFVANLLPFRGQTIIAAGAGTSLRPIVLRDSLFADGQAHARLVHAAALADTLTLVLDGPSGTRTFARVAYRHNTGYVALAPGAYTLTVQAPGGAVLLRESVDLPASPARTFVVRSASVLGGLALIEAVDAVPDVPTD